MTVTASLRHCSDIDSTANDVVVDYAGLGVLGMVKAGLALAAKPLSQRQFEANRTTPQETHIIEQGRDLL